MDNPMTSATVPRLPIRVEVSPALYQRDGMKTVGTLAVAQAVSDLLCRLGIPGQPDVTWEPASEPSGCDQPVAIYANGRICRYPDELILVLYSYVLGTTVVPFDDLKNLDAWLATAEQNLVAEWLGLLSKHACGIHARVLLGAEAARTYCTEFEAATGRTAPDPTRMASLLARALDLGISLKEYSQVAAALDEGAEDDDAVAELLISKLRPDHIDMRMEPGFLRWLSSSEGARAPERFRFLREALFAERGVMFPRFRIVADETLRPRGFAFWLNHLPGIPLIALPPDSILVNDVPTNLEGVDARPALNPTTCTPGAIAHRETKERLEAAGRTCWESLDHVILLAAGVLRASAARLVDRSVILQMLEEVGWVFPELTKAAREHLSLDELTAILRGIVAEQISIRNLPYILGLSLEHKLFVQPDADLNKRISYILSGLAAETTHQYKKDGAALVVYLLDPAVERTILATEDLQDIRLTRQLTNAIRAELQRSPATAGQPPLLVSEAVSARLRTMLRVELPRIRVLSITQLMPDVNVQPVARIGLAA